MSCGSPAGPVQKKGFRFDSTGRPIKGSTAGWHEYDAPPDETSAHALPPTFDQRFDAALVRVNTMNLKLPFRPIQPWLPVALSAMLAGSTLAQTAPTPPAPAPDETVMLSPFVLQEDQDAGYAPNETLSGTRLRTQTKDVASAMTIVTTDLMKDIVTIVTTDLMKDL